MLNSEKIVRFEHIKNRREFHDLHCLKSWLTSHNFDFRHFVSSGYSVEELRAACPTPNEELEDLIQWIEQNDLW